MLIVSVVFIINEYRTNDNNYYGTYCMVLVTPVGFLL